MIKEEDIQILNDIADNGRYGNHLHIGERLTIKDAELIKQQILENQRIVERLESRINELQKFLDDIESAKEVIDNMSSLAGMLEKQQLKELQSILKGENK